MTGAGSWWTLAILTPLFVMSDKFHHRDLPVRQALLTEPYRL